MSQMENLRYTLCIAVIVAFISSGFCCLDMEYQCNSGECINLDKLCDGNADCTDGSDETADSCIQQSCPAYSHRCAYGACVTGTALCNGIKECADNSDEASVLCGTDKVKSTKCLDEQFQCDTGECIDQENACDGFSDCPDQSDETVEVCASNYCPPYGFRCGYGACIGNNKKCDGVPDCRDGSDETYNLCGTPPSVSVPDPTPRPPGPTRKPTPTPKPTLSGCIAPNIPNSRLVYEANQTKVIEPGEVVPDTSSIVYLCKSKYSREGVQFNLCFKSEWKNKVDAQCIKYCQAHILNGVTFRTECSLNGATVTCGDRIKPGTSAKVTCRVGYRKPERNPPDVLVCQEDGTWDYEPFRCEAICGEELPRVTAFLIGENTNITEVPWHVGIYHNHELSGVYKHHCGGTIISAKVVLSAAHCFWDFANETPFHKSYYLVGAGKYYRDYNRKEASAQFQNISEIAISSDFTGDVHNYKGDIAVLLLNDFLTFSAFIAPVCLEWKAHGDKSIGSNIFGRVAGWGIDETEAPSIELRSAEMSTTSYEDCKKEVGTTLANAVTNDKFCVLNRDSQIVCQGDSGGGFTVKRVVDGKNIYYMWGVVSGGVPTGRKCREYEFVSYTNVQFYESLIEQRIIYNRPK